MTWLRHQGSGPSPSDGGLSPLGVAVFLLVHVPLGIAARDYSYVSTIYAFMVLVLGVGLALKGYERCVAAWAAYLVGVEVFWRMTRASVPWEFGKYAFVLVVGLAILRSGRFRGAALPGVYAALLAPSALLVVWEYEPWIARDQISFNLSGPLSLAVGAWFFSRLALPKRDIPLVLVALGGPTLCILSDAASSMLGSASLTFRLESNFEASGGYGPNQVSSMLGLGALCFLLLFATTRASAWFNGMVLALCLALLTQAALTYSRGGVYTTAAAAVSGAFYLMRQGRLRKRLLIGGALAVAVALGAVVPWLERLTEGTIASRFADTNVTGRDVLVKADLLTWEQNPLLGVGPGMAKAESRHSVEGNGGTHGMVATSGGTRGSGAGSDSLLAGDGPASAFRSPFRSGKGIVGGAPGMGVPVHVSCRRCASRLRLSPSRWPSADGLTKAAGRSRVTAGVDSKGEGK